MLPLPREQAPGSCLVLALFNVVLIALFLAGNACLIPLLLNPRVSMSSSNNPSDANARDGAPPRPTQPPQYSEQGAAEPRQYVSDSSSRAHPPPQRDAPPPAESKPEASSYAGAYRPSDAARLSATSVSLYNQKKDPLLKQCTELQQNHITT